MGVEAEDWHTYAVGERVMTVDGYPGVVQEVVDGPYPGTERYAILLDDGMGGGDYSLHEIVGPYGDSERTASRENGWCLCSECGLSSTPEKLIETRGHCPKCNALFYIGNDGWFHTDAQSGGRVAKLAGIEGIPPEVLKEYNKGWNAGANGAYDALGRADARGASSWWKMGWIDRNGGLEKYESLQEPLANGYFTAKRTAARQARPLLPPDQASNLASEDYPELAEILYERPDWIEVDDASATLRLSKMARKEAADTPWLDAKGDPIKDSIEDKDQPWWWRKVVGPALDRFNQNLPPGNQVTDITRIPAIQWCRFRRDGHCWFPNEIDEKGTKEAGYAVWVPFDQGVCPRISHKAQKDCPVSEPGPDSGESVVRPDATIPWSQGGQRQNRSYATKETPVELTARRYSGTPLVCDGCGCAACTSVSGGKDGHTMLCDDCRNAREEAKAEPKEGSVKKAAWADIVRKAKSIRRSGGVRVVAVTDNTITGEVKGTHDIYLSTITREPGTKRVGLWDCTCPWNTYAWARSEPWKQLEGRMCAHVLALSYEAQAQEMFGGELSEATEAPAWRTQEPAGYRAMLTASLAIFDEMVGPLLDDEVVRKASSFSDIKVKVRNQIVRLLDLFGNGQAEVENLGTVPVREIHYPTTGDLARGLNYRATKQAMPEGTLIDDGSGIVGGKGNWRELEPGMWLMVDDYGMCFAYERERMTPEAQARFDAKYGPGKKVGWQRKLNTFLIDASKKNREGTAGSLEAAKTKATEAGQKDFDEAHAKSLERTRQMLGPDWGTPNYKGAVRTPDGVTVPEGSVLCSDCDGWGEVYDDNGNGDVCNRCLGRGYVKASEAKIAGPVDPDDIAWEYHQDTIQAWKDEEDLGSGVSPEQRDIQEMFEQYLRLQVRPTALTHTAQMEDAVAKVKELCGDVEFTHAGLIIKALDSGRVLMTQRTPYHQDDEGTYGAWEFPGGGLDEGENPIQGALREFTEETGLAMPDGWALEDCYLCGESYCALVVVVPNEAWTTNVVLLDREVMGVGWFDQDQIEGSTLARPEVQESTDWELVSEAIVHDEPEPALPVAYGTEEDDEALLEGPPPPADEDLPTPGDPRLAWVMGDVKPGDQAAPTAEVSIADAAEQWLAKDALKAFTPAEKDSIINEGGTIGASNLSDLDLSGTHYQWDDDDDSFTW